MTLKLWLKKFGVQTARLVFSCSCFAAIATASAQVYTVKKVTEWQPGTGTQLISVPNSVYAEMDKELKGAADAYAAQKIVMDHKALLAGDQQLLSIAEAGGSNLKEIRNAVELRDVATQRFIIPKNVKALAGGATSGLVDSSSGKKEQANWLSHSLDKVGNLFKSDKRIDPPSLPSSNPGSVPMNLLQVFAWSLLGLVAIGMIVAVVKSVKVDGLRKKKLMIDDDEPDRTLDEWLVLADQHEAAGDFRQAVRCLYVACLMRFDEAGVAAFVRGQTNWEHLSRVRNSPRLPADLDFVTPTQEFDRIWYGMQVRGKEDVELFRFTYRLVCDQLRGKAA